MKSNAHETQTGDTDNSVRKTKKKRKKEKHKENTDDAEEVKSKHKGSEKTENEALAEPCNKVDNERETNGHGETATRTDGQ